jgi:hypothetical protein
MSKRLILLLAAVMALAVIAAGCGSSDDDSTEATVTLTKAEFIKQGDAICEKSNKQSESEAEEFAEENGFDLENPDKEKLEEAIVEVLVPSLNQQAEEIDALGAPEGDEEKVEAIVASLEDAAAEIEDDPGSVFEGGPLKEPSKLAGDYGFKVCGEE